ncbi:MAG: hypothetical protein IAG10_19360, partial [Planctomycetaceae bacterium]|nr:hypothetical protein [Planctomycetaceae bacterium]
ADVELEDVQYDFGHEIVLTGFSLTPPNGDVPIVRLPETVVHINRDALIERQQVEVLKVVVKSPRLEVVRGPDGSWNWQSLRLPPQQEKGSLPEFAIEDGTVVVRVEQAPGVPPGVLVLEHMDIELLPSGKRQYQIKASSNCEHTGAIELSGRWSIDEQTGQLDGKLTQITAGQELVGVAASFAPEVRTKLAEWEAKFLELLSKPADAQGGSPFGVSGPIKAAGAADSILGLKAKFNVAFRVTRPEPKTTPTFRVAMNIVDGEITNPALPFPLQDLRGELYADNDRFLVKELTAHNGATKLLVDGKLEGREAGYPGRIELNVNNVVCDQRLRSRLSAGFGRIYDQHQPQGDLDMHAVLAHDGGRWRPEVLNVTAKDCSVMHEAFPYPVEHANGSITLQDGNLIIDVSGMAGDRPITLEGTVVNPGANATILLTIRTSDLPIDATFIKACTPQLRSAIQRMRLTGVMDGEVRLTKAPQQPFVTSIEALLRNGAMNYDAFPYRVEGITGRLSAIGPNFKFKELIGRHGKDGTTVIAAKGDYGKLNNNVGELNLRIVTQAAPLDESLYRAVPASLQRVWREFRPTGLVDVVTDVHWLTDRAADIRMSSIELTKGSLSLKMLPYRLDELRASYEYGPDQNGLPMVIVKSIQARHDETTLSATGYQSVDANGNWRAHYDKFTVENLTPNQELLDALSQLPGLRQLFASLDPKQTLRFDGAMDFKGTSDPTDPITAAWDLDTYFFGGTMHTGLDFKNLRGKVHAKGNWDGQEVKVTGDVDLSSARILDYDLTDVRGPFRVSQGALMFGAGDTQRVRPPGSLEDRERITARLFDGTLLLDGVSTLSETPEYEVLLQLRNARLEKFAALHAPKQRDLRGITNGSVQLKGKGSTAQGVKGRGTMQISPAALLDMPVVLQMYHGLSLTPPEDYTFKSARLDFDIGFARFLFRSIVLEGDTISFVGRGTADFENNVNLDFYSRLPRSQIPIPLLHDLIGAATKGWVQIAVTGKLSEPQTKIKAVAPLDDVLKIFPGFVPPPISPIGQGFMPKGTSRQ